MSTLRTRVEHALDLARRGLSAFPLVHNTKEPQITQYTQYATRNKEILRAWFKNEDAPPNIAVSTDKMLLLDVDPRNGGIATWEALSAQQEIAGQPFPKTARAITQSGGAHIYYSLPEGVKISGGTHKLGAGLDVKARGGYVGPPVPTLTGDSTVGQTRVPLPRRPRG
jgi:hypothetical protein